MKIKNYISKQGFGVQLFFDDENEFSKILNSFLFFKKDVFEEETCEEVDNIIDAFNQNKKISKDGKISTILYDKMCYDFISVMLNAVGIFELLKKNYNLLSEQTNLKQKIIDLQQKRIDELEKN